MDLRVEEIWAAARAVPAEDRDAWLEERCGGDVALRDEVASLLRHADKGAAFFAKLTGSVHRSAEELSGAALDSGTRIGPYVLIREIGRGGMGQVYEGQDPRLDRRVALKVLPPWLAADPGARKRLVAEARAASAIDHPNLATLHDVVELADGSLCLVLAHYEGETLKERLDRGPMPVAEAVDAVRQAARGLAEVHRRGIVHRDVKPANLFLTAEGRVVVLDFGIAKVQGADPTGRSVRPGTVAYMAPEQARGDAVDARTDVWALGVVLYETVAGRNPFRRDAEAATLDAIARHEPRQLDAVRPGVPRSVAQAAARALAKAPAARYADAGALATALESRVASRQAVRPWLVAALLTLLASGAWLEHGARSPAGTRAGAAAVSRVAVLPFEIRGDPSLDYLGEGLASLLSVSLDGAGVRSVDPFTVFERAGNDDAIAPARARRIADGLGAGRFVLGQVVAVGDRLRVQAFLYDRTRGSEPIARVSVEGAVDRIFNLVDEIASQMLVAERGGPGEDLTQVAAVTTSSIDAFKWYLEGEQHFHAGQFSEAVASLERAVAADSTFALAWYRLSEASGWLTDFDREIEAAEIAGRFTDRLPPVERRILRAHLLWPRGEVAEAERLYLEGLEARPESADAWYGLGELYFHVNPMRGRSSTEARWAFERSVALSGRERFEALVHLADLAAWEGRFADYDSLFARFPREGDFALVYAVQHALITGDEPERARAVERLRTAGPVPSLHVARRMGAFTRSPAGALRAARVVVEQRTDARNQAAGHLTAAVLETALGHWPAARRHLDRAELLSAPSARLYRAWLAAHPTLAVPRTELESIRASLENWDPRRPPSRPEALSVDADLHGPLRTYAIGLLSARLEDVDAVRRNAAALARIDSPESQQLPRDLGRELEAHALALEGEWDDALAALESTRATRDYERTVRSPFFQMGQARWLRAEILEALGRRREALEWYRVVPQMYFDAVVFQAPAARREEAILATLGE